MDRYTAPNGEQATLVQIVGADEATPVLDAADETGASVAVDAGDYAWTAWGTWDGATAQLQFSPDGGTTWIDIDGAVLTANGGFTRIGLGTGHVRVAIDDAGTTAISSTLQRMS